MNGLANELEDAVASAEKELRAIPDSVSARRRAPGKWSAREILGHLIDSAANNHARFVSGSLKEDLVFPGYAQDEWVVMQNYQSRSWPDLVDLWTSYNRHLSHVIASIPEEAMKRQRTKHNFHVIGWKTVPASEPSTLEYFVRDYIGHLQHHLQQIRAVVT